MKNFARLFFTALMFVIAACPVAEAEVCRAFYEETTLAGANANEGWTFNKSYIGRIGDGEEQGRNLPIMFYDDLLQDYREYDDFYCVFVEPGGVLEFKGVNGIKQLEFNFAAYNEGDASDFMVELIAEDCVVHKFEYKGDALDFYEDHSLVRCFSEQFDGVHGDYKLKITNRSKASTRWGRILMWNFCWEDRSDDVIIEQGDDKLCWSQSSGRYANGTVVFVKGIAGCGLHLYDGSELVEEQAAAENEIPLICYHLQPDHYAALRALSGDVESLHNFVTSADAAEPSLAVSLPEGVYEPGAEFVVTGLPGKDLSVMFRGSESGEQTEIVAADGDCAPVGTLSLPGCTDEVMQLSIGSEGAETLTRTYYLNHIWKPTDAATAVNLQCPDALFSGSRPLVPNEDGSPLILAGLRISNSPAGDVWLSFSDAELVKENGVYCVLMAPNSTMTVGASYSGNDSDELTMHVVTVQKESELILAPGELDTDTEFNKHEWHGMPQISPEGSRESEFTASAAVRLLGVECSYRLATGVDEVSSEISEPLSPEYYDLYGRRLLGPAQKGLYIQVSGAGRTLFKK